jgi:hypothetical protein
MARFSATYPCQSSGALKIVGWSRGRVVVYPMSRFRRAVNRHG